jgi:hypothetical protein
MNRCEMTASGHKHAAIVTCAGVSNMNAKQTVNNCKVFRIHVAKITGFVWQSLQINK